MGARAVFGFRFARPGDRDQYLRPRLFMVGRRVFGKRNPIITHPDKIMLRPISLTDDSALTASHDASGCAGVVDLRGRNSYTAAFPSPNQLQCGTAYSPNLRVPQEGRFLRPLKKRRHPNFNPACLPSVFSNHHHLSAAAGEPLSLPIHSPCGTAYAPHMRVPQESRIGRWLVARMPVSACLSLTTAPISHNKDRAVL